MQFLHIHNYENCTLKYKYFCSIAFAYDAVHFVHCLHRLREEEATTRVGKVSGIEVSGRVSGMPEMPGTKPRFWAPENLEI